MLRSVLLGRYCRSRPFVFSCVRRMDYDTEDVCAIVRNVFQGRVDFHDGDEDIAPEISVHLAPGYTASLQFVRVAPATAGWSSRQTHTTRTAISIGRCSRDASRSVAKRSLASIRQQLLDYLTLLTPTRLSRVSAHCRKQFYQPRAVRDAAKATLCGLFQALSGCFATLPDLRDRGGRKRGPARRKASKAYQ